MGRKYRYKSAVLYVKKYKSANADSWGTFFTDRKGYERAYTTEALPLGHATEEEAQRALDAFAAAQGLKEARK